MLNKSVLLETSFFIRLLNPNDPLARQAEGYFRFFQQEKYAMLISTVSIAEFCVIGSLDQLPLKNLQVAALQHGSCGAGRRICGGGICQQMAEPALEP